ncbi:DUF4494 domain-containing protein [Tellurirhabdus bombi]|uniref:DUF4494 domain-containing protein n=1 Tax=Tellurirhabdus bombi TaxID=2907205 RepID=UPI001F2F1031|nr:DUF4494 domain-containing protein [Tellurirhabdus bombi]
MPSWYQGKIRYQKEEIVTDRRGDQVKLKTINESYLVDAVSYTDAEARLYKEVAANTPNFSVATISPMRLADVFHFEEGGDTWYKCKVVYVTEDDKGREKRIVNMMLVNAENAKQAYERVEQSLKTMLIPFEITDVNTTKILDIFPYMTDEEAALPPNLRPLSEVIAQNE